MSKFSFFFHLRLVNKWLLLYVTVLGYHNYDRGNIATSYLRSKGIRRIKILSLLLPLIHPTLAVYFGNLILLAFFLYLSILYYDKWSEARPTCYNVNKVVDSIKAPCNLCYPNPYKVERFFCLLSIAPTTIRPNSISNNSS